MPRKRQAPVVTSHLVNQCIRLIRDVAEIHGICPKVIIGYARGPKPDEARRQVMRLMITELGMARYQVAEVMRRDPRRVRKSVLGV